MARVRGLWNSYSCSSGNDSKEAQSIWTHGMSMGYARMELRRIHCSRPQIFAKSALNWALPGMKMHDPVEGLGATLLYEPYMAYLCLALLRTASGLQPLPLEDDLRMTSSSKSTQKANVYNWLYCSNRLRRVRITYFDAGKACQAFNALLYPDYRFDLPLLGIDLLSFGSSKVLCVVDFIPLSRDPNYLHKHIHQLGPIRQPFAKFCSQMSERFFDKELFASEQMIFFRSDLGGLDPELQVPNGGLYKVYVQYVEAYLRDLHSMQPGDDQSCALRVQEQQNAYDRYLAERDPAFRVFSSYFGKQWTKRFCTDFLSPGTHMEEH